MFKKLFLFLFAWQVLKAGEEPYVYPVAQFEFAYENEHPSHPPIEILEEAKAILSHDELAFFADDKGTEIFFKDLKPGQYYGSALIAITSGAVARFKELGLMGIYVTVDPEQIDSNGVDRRHEDAALRILVSTYPVVKVNTIGMGERVDFEQEKNLSMHKRIRKISPVKPLEEGEQTSVGYAPSEGDLLNKDDLENFLAYLNRYPGRRVDLQVSSTEEGDGFQLDYLVTENRPYIFYFDATNTGTSRTPTVLERIGFVHYQLTNRDDTLLAEYATTSLSNFHSGRLGYSTPICNDPAYRIGADLYLSNFDASEFGIAEDEFSGRQRGCQLEAKGPIACREEWFFDWVVRLNLKYFKVVNKIFEESTSTAFLLPSAGFQFEKTTPALKCTGEVLFEANLPEVLETDADLAGFGRSDARRDFVLVSGSGSCSFFLDPCFEEKPDPLAFNHHELFFLFDGQYTFGKRVIPQFEKVYGGMHSVRGYPQSVASGATALLGRLEYHYHHPLPFSKSRIIGRAFFDAGYTTLPSKQEGEVDFTLLGTGCGVELVITEHFRGHADLGVALNGITPRNYDAGSLQVHGGGTFIF